MQGLQDFGINPEKVASFLYVTNGKEDVFKIRLKKEKGQFLARKKEIRIPRNKRLIPTGVHNNRYQETYEMYPIAFQVLSELEKTS